jgi:hypothetical protein
VGSSDTIYLEVFRLNRRAFITGGVLCGLRTAIPAHAATKELTAEFPDKSMGRAEGVSFVHNSAFKIICRGWEKDNLQVPASLKPIERTVILYEEITGQAAKMYWKGHWAVLHGVNPIFDVGSRGVANYFIVQFHRYAGDAKWKASHPLHIQPGNTVIITMQDFSGTDGGKPVSLETTISF